MKILNFGQVYIESETFIEACDLTPYNDLIFDNSSNNIIHCSGGDDLVSLSFGNDQVFGGLGSDEVSIYGNSEDYSKTGSGMGIQLQNINDNSENYFQTIYLEDIEFISFYETDGTVSHRTELMNFIGAAEPNPMEHVMFDPNIIPFI